MVEADWGCWTSCPAEIAMVQAPNFGNLHDLPGPGHHKRLPLVRNWPRLVQCWSGRLLPTPLGRGPHAHEEPRAGGVSTF